MLQSSLPPLKEIMYLIAKGLYQKAQQASKNSNKYPDSSTLRHGLNKLLVYVMIHNCWDDANGKWLAPIDEADAIRNYFSEPTETWMRRWSPGAWEEARNDYIAEWDALINLGMNNTFYTTEFCEELSAVYRVVETEMEQERLFDALKRCKQGQYVAFRKFLIDQQHRVMKKDELNIIMQDFEVKFGDMDMAKNVMSSAYENADVINDHKLAICKRCVY